MKPNLHWEVAAAAVTDDADVAAATACGGDGGDGDRPVIEIRGKRLKKKKFHCSVFRFIKYRYPTSHLAFLKPISSVVCEWPLKAQQIGIRGP